ncbi:MAG: AlpA family phage regulatory protein [Cellvibrionaceae bacterium]
MNNEKKFFRSDELATRWGVSKTTIWRWRREKLIPPPLALGPRMVGWHIEVIEAVERGMKARGGIL